MNSINILLVNDEANLHNIKKVLQFIPDCNVHEAQNAQAALKIIAQHQINLILLSTRMPGLDGFDFATILQNNEEAKDIALIFMASSNEVEIQNALKIIRLQNLLETQNQYINSLLQASNEGQIIIDKYSIILDFNKKASDLFLHIQKGITLNKLFEEEEEREIIKLKSYLNTISLEANSTQVFKHENKYYKISYKFLSEKKHMFSFFDVTKEIKESKRKDVIYNSQRAIVVVAQGAKIQDVNKIFFEEFGFKNLEDFKSKHQCICELFVKVEGEDFLLSEVDGYSWNRYLQLYRDKLHRVCMIGANGKEKVYEVKTSGNIFADELEQEEVIVFHDITEQRNQKKILINQSRQAAMGEMIAMIAHQWRQPLTTIVVILSKIKIKYDLNVLTPKDFQTDLDATKSVVQHLSKTIDLFQDYFKEKDGTKILASELFENVFKIVKPLLQNANIELAPDCNDLICNNTQYMIDNRLDHVLLNIYQNATDALKQTSVINNKTIKTKIRINEKNQIVITICDNAGGISSDILAKVFNPYFSTKSKNGSGLGLYMSKNIVESHIGGKLNAYNNAHGACFEILLPANTPNKETL